MTIEPGNPPAGPMLNPPVERQTRSPHTTSSRSPTGPAQSAPNGAFRLHRDERPRPARTRAAPTRYQNERNQAARIHARKVMGHSSGTEVQQRVRLAGSLPLALRVLGANQVVSGPLAAVTGVRTERQLASARSMKEKSPQCRSGRTGVRHRSGEAGVSATSVSSAASASHCGSRLDDTSRCS